MRTTPTVNVVTVKLTRAEVQKLERLGRAGGTTRSELIRLAIRQLPEGPAADSLGALAADLCGIVTTAPADLSTNPAHFEDFGE